jgi:hypothetical protein
MRGLGPLIALVAACGVYDPVAEVPHHHREVPDTASAIAAILAENPAPRVYAIGEYHQSRDAIAKTSPLAHFTQEIIGLIEPRAHHLVVEAWLDDACQADQLQRDLAAATARPGTTQMELLRLVRRSRLGHLEPHGLPMTCIEHDAVLDARHHVDFLLLLEVITDKLHDTTAALLASDPDHAVIVYGGALHNDLYPRWLFDDLSYAKPLARELGPGAVLEIDLVVPEVVAGMQMIRDEPWFPLLGRASPSRVIVWQRGPSSYVVILPAQSEEVARVAQPVDVM